ncbi:MAG: TetR/AcrR family transcriptional regulator [Spirochaetales bacterium]|nr:TetR/AcrR family transcriptional regulator [Leptospiraceae bacterium]MCP5482663.1 TetR/AcrR family transcriptional regulator [Spirochaetales bacterium]MCP5485045.1 TetR/AcrR family transcriptional regulator [Spirochaetales bacterium]
MTATEKETATRVLDVARTLFARHGYEGVSVRDICREAGTNANAVHYYFQSKEALYETILHEFGQDLLRSAQRILTDTPASREELRTRLQIFLEELIVTLLEKRDLVLILHTEFMHGGNHCDSNAVQSFARFPRFIVEYLDATGEAGLLRPDVDPEILTQLLIRPSVTAVLSGGNSCGGRSLWEPEFRARWIAGTLSILLSGALRDE